MQTANTSTLTDPDVLERLAEMRQSVQQALEAYCEKLNDVPDRLRSAIAYSLLAPGKRLRPLLALEAAEAVGGTWTAALPAACAVEMIHAYSLIHDDLPAMDNDDLRRGQPTCHRQFDEATAILAGDALQALAFEALASDIDAQAVAACCLELAKAAGPAALVGGQQDDLAAEGRFGFCPYGASPEEKLNFLQRVHQRKTGAMITVSLKLGALAVGANRDQLAALEVYGSKLGLAFQIVDDLLDVESTVEMMGKHTGKDEALGKLTYPGLLGVEQSRQWARNLVDEACQALDGLGQAASPLVTMARFVLERNN